MPQIEALHGRASDQLMVQSAYGQSVVLPALVFQNVTDHDARIIEWRVVQEGKQDLVLEWQTTARSEYEQSIIFAEFEAQITSSGLAGGLSACDIRNLTSAVLDPMSGKRRRLLCMSAIDSHAATSR